MLLPEILRDRGYATYAVSGNIAASEKFGFNQGYDAFHYRYIAPADWVNARATECLAEHRPEQPVFMYMHTMEPHAPDTPTPASLRLFDRGLEGRLDGSQKSMNNAGRIRPDLSADDVEHLIDLYDAEIYDADRWFAHFLSVLKESDRLDDALIILVSDHGEAFNEHRTIGHGHTLGHEEMHVPLIIRYPNGRFRGVRVSQRVSLIDVLPTILSAVGIDAEIGYPLPGRNLSPEALPSEGETSRPIYCEVVKRAGLRIDLVGTIDEDGYKRVLNTTRPRRTKASRATRESIGLWNTNVDIGEQVNLGGGNPVRAAYGEQLIARRLEEQRYWRETLAREPAPAVELTDDVRGELRGLGYLD